VAPLLAAHGLDRQSGGNARKADPAIAAGVPGDTEVGFPDGSLPPGGLPGPQPPRELWTSPACGSTPADVGEQLALL
jgi:hypothetical protein